MESHGLTGEIQVTERVAAALREQFVIRPRGTVAVKGKGLMQTFLLTGQLPEAATAEMPAVRPESTNTEVI